MVDGKYKSALGPSIERFVAFKEALSGKVGKTRRWYMASFDAYCAEHGHRSCTKEAVEGWGDRIDQSQKSEVRQWIGNIRELARFLQVNGDPDAYILADGYRQISVKPKPCLLSQGEIDAFFEAAWSFKTRKGPWQWQAPAFFGLMHSCGLRTCEVRALTTNDVDIANQSIDILGSKGNRSRRIYVTDDVAAVLEECKWATDRMLPAADRPFFVSKNGTPVDASSSGEKFRAIRTQAGLPLTKGGKRVRAYDFRHHFAYANIERWAREGVDVNAMLPVLARYMGHSSVETTLYYVHTSPDFMAEYASAVRMTESVLPEVGFDD